ncbi:MAG: hypothetical protein AB7F74_24950, partial [Parvibaculaceae bacterium]
SSIHLWIKDMQTMHGATGGTSAATQQDFTGRAGVLWELRLQHRTLAIDRNPIKLIEFISLRIPP